MKEKLNLYQQILEKELQPMSKFLTNKFLIFLFTKK